MGGGRQWFALDAYDPELLRRDPQQTAAVYAAMGAAAAPAAAVLNGFLDAELARHNLSGSRLALVGFSQGTMMALQVGLRRMPALAAIMGYSGALLAGDDLKETMHGRPPVMLLT